jgi:hypothetical protein
MLVAGKRAPRGGGGRLPTCSSITRNSAPIAAWFVVIKYKFYILPNL